MDIEADIFAVFHWTPEVTGRMFLGELMGWWKRAKDRLPAPPSQ